jgi:hypothetical protein
MKNIISGKKEEVRRVLYDEYVKNGGTDSYEVFREEFLKSVNINPN